VINYNFFSYQKKINPASITKLFVMKNTNSSDFQNLVVQVFQSKKFDFIYVIKSGNTFFNIVKSAVSKQIPSPGIYLVRAKQYINDKGFDSLYIHTASLHIPA